MTEELGARIRRRIEETGPISFAEFMETALYDSDGGFYEGGGRAAAGRAVGADGDFVTSPHVSPVFGSLLARLLEEMRESLDRPPAFTVVEVGAGDGTLARSVAAGLSPAGWDQTELVLVERTTAHRAHLETAAAQLPVRSRVARTVGELAPGSVVGCVLANELLDNLPFHRVRRTSAGPVELYVETSERGLVLAEGPPSSEEAERLAAGLAVGQEAVLPAAALAFLADAAALLERGYLLLIDYAATPDEAGLAVHGYRGHHPVADVLAHPGRTDVTAGVDFDLVARRAGEMGLTVWGPVTQRDTLLALGYAEEVETLRRRQVELLDAGRGLEAARLFSARNGAGLLIDPGGLGGFRVLCLGKGPTMPPRFLASRARPRLGG